MKHTPGSFSVRFPNTAVRRFEEMFPAHPPRCPNRKVALSETVSKSGAERTNHTRVRKTVAFVLNRSDTSLRREEKNHPHFRKKFKNRRTVSEGEPLIAAQYGSLQNTTEILIPHGFGMPADAQNFDFFNHEPSVVGVNGTVRVR
jgi:hypothetical protein